MGIELLSVYFKSLSQDSQLQRGSGWKNGVRIHGKHIFVLVYSDSFTQDLNLKSAVGDMWLKTLKGDDFSLNVKCNSSKGLTGEVERYHTLVFVQKCPK